VAYLKAQNHEVLDDPRPDDCDRRAKMISAPDALAVAVVIRSCRGINALMDDFGAVILTQVGTRQGYSSFASSHPGTV
jgi:hypothetical protein